MATSLIIKTMADDTTIQKTITNVNPETNFSDLNSFARAMNGLTTNTYVDTYKITRESVNENISAGE